MVKGSRFSIVSIFVVIILACVGQAAEPVCDPGSRFVWEPGENLTFTWTNENFDGFYYDAQRRTGKEYLNIKLDNIKDRSIPEGGMVYSTTVETAVASYTPFGEHEVIWFMGYKYLAGNPEGKSNISEFGGINLNRLQGIMIDDDIRYRLAGGGTLPLSGGYALEVKYVDAADSQVTLSLRWEGTEVDKKTIETGKNYVYKLNTGSVITVHIDSVFEEKGIAYVGIKGIFQISNYRAVNEGDIFGVMKITKISNGSITMSNFRPVDLKRGSIFEIVGYTKLKVADSNTLRLHLYSDRYENHEHRGAVSNNLATWDGLNYAGFLYDADSGNYSESLVITNMTGRRIPEGDLIYTSYIRRLPYAVTKITGEKIPGTDSSYVSFRLDGKKYTARDNGFAELLIAHGELMAHGDSSIEKKTLGIGYNEFSGETWDMGEGYTLTVLSVNYSKEPRKARLVLKRNGVELDDVWLKQGDVYRYAPGSENDMPKFITYLDTCFSGATTDMIQFRYTWFVSDNVTKIKVGDRLGIFNVTVMEPDRIELKNRVPIDLEAGSSINLFGNLSFYVENSDELRFYPISMGGTEKMFWEVPSNEVPDNNSTLPAITTPAETNSAAGRTESVPGFEVIISLVALFAIYRSKGGKDE